MKLMNDIPERFWGLFRSINRSVYIEALLKISEEYEFSNYYLSREVCIQLLNEYFSSRKCVIWQDDLEDDSDVLEPVATRVLNWLIKAGWLRKVEDYSSMTVYIVIPDYAAVMVGAFERLASEDEDETQIYIQNIYAILFSLKHDPRASVSLLNTAVINTRKLNKALQDMLFNMDKFFASLLEQREYGALLKDHLSVYVEQIVKKKYHILKTSDNFYLYKTDIKKWLRDMREDAGWMEQMRARSSASGQPFGRRTGEESEQPSGRRTGEESGQLSGRRTGEISGQPYERTSGDEADIIGCLDRIERGFDDIEHRIANMDKEHTRYVRATVTRLNYLLNQEDSMKGLVIQLLNHLSQSQTLDEDLKEIGERMNLSRMSILSEGALYKRRRAKQDFAENQAEEEETRELSKQEILNLNKVKNRYGREEIEAFIAQGMVRGRMEVNEGTVSTDGELEKLILAYDYSTRRKSLYRVEQEEPELIDNGRYRYPKFVFVRRNQSE